MKCQFPFPEHRNLFTLYGHTLARICIHICYQSSAVQWFQATCFQTLNTKQLSKFAYWHDILVLILVFLQVLGIETGKNSSDTMFLAKNVVSRLVSYKLRQLAHCTIVD